MTLSLPATLHYPLSLKLRQGVAVYLVTNRIADASSGPLSILEPGPNEQVPFDVLVYEVSRRDSGWWLERRARETIDDRVCRDIRNYVKDHGVLSTAALYPAFQTAMATLESVWGEARERSVLLFSRCNGEPTDALERGLSIEAGGDYTVVCFSCPVERRRNLFPGYGLDQGRRAGDRASAAG